MRIMTNHLTRLRLLNHRANRLNRPERIREAIVIKTGERINIASFGRVLRYSYTDIKTDSIYFKHHLTILDNPEEGD
jgi:hypothetical protein